VVTVHRLGWYGGEGGREIWRSPGPARIGLALSQPAIEPGPQVPSAAWPVADMVPIGADWVSGQYLARLQLVDGEHAGSAAHVPFVVRAPLSATRAEILVQLPVTTMQAYNHWGGKSLYVSNSSDGVPAVRVTFDRPVPTWHEANLNARWPFIWDLNLIRFLEREGYDLAYTTDLDTHRMPWSLLGHPLLVTSGHDEYWSAEMRDGFDAAVGDGSSLLVSGANTCYWQTRFEDGGRTMVQYRRAAADPEPDPARKTVKFRELIPPRPESQLFGIEYQDGLAAPGSEPMHYTVAAGSEGDPWLSGTGLGPGDVLEYLVGYEWDALVAGQELRDATVFFHCGADPSDAHAVRHRTDAGGIVFATGSLQFSWGLDDWRHGRPHPGLQQFMRNALEDMIRSGHDGLSA
jgi:hypothetical protein